MSADRSHPPDARAPGTTPLVPPADAAFAPALGLAALDQLSEGVIITDAAGRITFVNEAARRLHGVARLEVDPEAYAATYHLLTEDGRPYPSTELPLARVVLRGETVTEARWRIRRPDGREVLAVGSARPVRAADGAQVGAVLTLRDDSARADAVDALHAANTQLATRNAALELQGHELAAANAQLEAANTQLQELALETEVTNEELFDATADLQCARDAIERERSRLDRVIAQLPLPVVVMEGPALVVRAASEQYARIVGGRDLVGRPIREALAELTGGADGDSAETGTDYFALLERVYATGTPVAAIGQVQRWDGDADGVPEPHTVDLVYAPFRAPDPERGGPGPVEGVTAVVVDTSARAAAEAALRESEARFRNVADAAPVMLWVTDAEGRCTFLNRAWLEFTGQTFEEGLGHGWLDVVHPDDAAESARAFREATSRSAPFQLDYRVRRRDGVYRRAVDAAAPRVDPDGTFRGYVGSVVDVEEGARLLEQAQDERDRSALLADVSAVLAGSLDVEDTVRRAARLAVPAFADYCVVDLLMSVGDEPETGGAPLDLRRLAEAHVDPEGEALLRGTAAHYGGGGPALGEPPDPSFGGAAGGGPLVAVARDGGVRLVEHVDDAWVAAASRSPAHLADMRALGPRSVIAAGLQARGQALGVMSFVRSQAGVAAGGHPFTAEDAALAQQLASRAANAVDRSRLYRGAREARDALAAANASLESALADAVAARQAAERSAQRTERLQALTAALAAAATPEDVARAAVAQGVAVTGGAAGVLALLAPEGGEFAIVEAQGYVPGVVEPWRRFSTATRVPLGDVVRTGEPVLLDSAEARAARYPLLADSPNTYTGSVSVPLTVEGSAGGERPAGGGPAAAGPAPRRVLGALGVSFAPSRRPGPEEVELLAAVAAQTAVALERARLLEAERAARAEADRARAEAEAHQRAAEQANKAKGDFLAVMSHELRTPLNAIGGYAQLLELGLHGPVTDEQRVALGRVQRAQQHLLALINDILNYAKLESGRVEYDVQAVDVRGVVSDVAPLVEPQMASKGLAFEVRLPAAPCTAWADREKLGQVLVNLLSNALKFTDAAHPETGERGLVTVTLGGRPGRPDLVFVRVTDTGRGVPRDRQEAIFEPFVQVRTGFARGTEGTGLGLAISRDLARGMGGDLRVRSAPGEGSTFTIALRRATAADGAATERRVAARRRDAERREAERRAERPTADA